MTHFSRPNGGCLALSQVAFGLGTGDTEVNWTQEVAKLEEETDMRTDNGNTGCPGSESDGQGPREPSGRGNGPI